MIEKPDMRATRPSTPNTNTAQVPQNVTISSPRLVSDVPPNFATVNAMPPNAPIGAAHMIRRMMRKMIWLATSKTRDDLLALHLREAGDRRGDEQREHEHAQDLVLHERRDEARRQQVVGDEADDALVAARLADRLLGVGAGGGGDLALEAAARLDDVAREQARGRAR